MNRTDFKKLFDEVHRRFEAACGSNKPGGLVNWYPKYSKGEAFPEYSMAWHMSQSEAVSALLLESNVRPNPYLSLYRPFREQYEKGREFIRIDETQRRIFSLYLGGDLEKEGASGIEEGEYLAYFWMVLKEDLWVASFNFSREKDGERIRVEASNLFKNNRNIVCAGLATHSSKDNIIEIDLRQPELGHSANIKVFAAPLVKFPDWGVLAGHCLTVSGNDGNPITVRPIVFVPRAMICPHEGPLQTDPGRVLNGLETKLRNFLLLQKNEHAPHAAWWKIYSSFRTEVARLLDAD